MPETNTQKVLRALLAPAPTLETACRQVLGALDIDTALGFMLELIGKRVGRPRNGVLDDEVYRRYIRGQISANKSDGINRDIIKVARAVVPEAVTILIQPVGAAASILRVEGIAMLSSAVLPLTDLVLRATSAGVRRIIGYSLDPPEDVLRWGTPDRVWGTAKWSHVTDTKEG